MFDTKLKLLKQTNTMESNEVTKCARACRSTLKSTPVSHRNRNVKAQTMAEMPFSARCAQNILFVPFDARVGSVLLPSTYIRHTVLPTHTHTPTHGL